MRRIPVRRLKWVVLALWVGVIAVLGPSAGLLSTVQKDDIAEYLPANADSARAVRRILGMQGDNLLPATIVYERESGVTAADRAKVAADLKAVARIRNVVAELPPSAGTAGRTFGPVEFKEELDKYRDKKGRLPKELRAVEAKFKIPYIPPAGKPVKLMSSQESADGQALRLVAIVRDTGVAETTATINEIRRVVRAGLPPGLSAHLTGTVGYQADAQAVFGMIDGVLVLAALGVAVVVLLITYRSVVLWAIPLFIVVLALAVAMGVSYLLAAAGLITVSSLAVSLLMVLVVGAGTDYALLLIARYREELRRHEDRHEAMAVAVRRASPAIVASAATVIAGLLCLMVAELNSTRGLGPVAAIGVACAMIAMITLLPAVMVVAGRWVFWPLVPRHDPGAAGESGEAGAWGRLGRWIGRRARLVWIVTCLALGVLVLGLTSYKEGGLANRDAFTGRPEAVVGEDISDRHFPRAAEDPVQVVATNEKLRDVIVSAARLDEVTSITLGSAGTDDVLVNVTLKDKPNTREGQGQVLHLRDRMFAVGAPDVNVGGTVALNYDLQRAAERDRLLIIPLVLLVVFIVLAMLLRAIVAPLLLLATVVLSFAATLGISAFLFEHVFGFAGVDQAFVLVVFVFLVALGVDYNIFLMHRVREESVRHGTRRGAILGLGATGGVITSAGLVLAGTFAMLGVLPMTQTVQIAVAVALGVLLDTMIVRSILVTALTLDVGDWVWWPGALARGSLPRPRMRRRQVPSGVRTVETRWLFSDPTYQPRL
ncbi:MMPL family transporter [Bailinhaonella thermotolerans]|uniref:MMPL family transporter n=1 Tax=Bailinhaonella thermotolerans TaxID=1070861 RepID=A0A3A4A6J6_9ACTN|nr:MMPL family transporter [Bailinhaonella thermotolerans]RJL21418.1 MMPL family transporter [Bailinhaonella thermotolerans]